MGILLFVSSRSKNESNINHSKGRCFVWYTLVAIIILFIVMIYYIDYLWKWNTVAKFVHMRQLLQPRMHPSAHSILKVETKARNPSNVFTYERSKFLSDFGQDAKTYSVWRSIKLCKEKTWMKVVDKKNYDNLLQNGGRVFQGLLALYIRS